MPFKCRVCHKSFGRMWSLERHQETKHPEVFGSVDKESDDNASNTDESNHEKGFADLVNPRENDIFDDDNESTKDDDDEDDDEDDDKNSNHDSEHEEDEVKYNFWGHLRQIVYKHNKAKINQMVEQLME